MKVCFVGTCGHTSQAYAALKKRADVEIVGVAPGSEWETPVRYDESIPLFDNWEKMLEETKPDLAVVSPVYALAGQRIIACAKRGIHVFSEKPVASSLEELELVERAVQESGIRFSAMHYLRYDPAFYYGAELVRSGAIGEVRLITAQKSYRYGTRPPWYGQRPLYGGTIPWVGIHAVDWIRHFSQKDFLSVTARSFGKDPEMAALCQFELGNGAMASVNIDFYRPNAAPTHGDDRIRVAGTAGVLEVRDKKILLIDGEGSREIEPGPAPELLTEFLNGGDPITPEEIFYITRVSLTARDAADTGRTLQIGD